MAKKNHEERALVPVSEYKFLQVVGNEAIQDNIGTGGINPFDLVRVKLPTGATTQWALPTLSGKDEYVEEISGVIVTWKDQRVYWASEVGATAGAPPDCSSADMVTGRGAPGGNCVVCPYAQWKSAPKGGGGQACKQTRMMFIGREDNLFPTMLILPPTSLQPMKQYFLKLASEVIPYWACITSLTLEKKTNKAGIPYAAVKPGFVEKISDEAVLGRIKDYRAKFNTYLENVEITKADINE